MQEFFKLIWTTIINYFKAELADKVKEAFLKGLEAFKEAVWAQIKDEVQLCVRAAITHAELYANSEEGKMKEEMAVNTIMEWIHLPVVLKPFRGLIKKIVRDKLHNLISDIIGKAKVRVKNRLG